MIQLRHITKRFGTLAALSDVSLQIPPASILGLLGENGAGKSTLMNILFGLLRPDAGTITFNDQPLPPSLRLAQRLGIGMVHQHFKLVPTLTALENLRLFLGGSAAAVRTQAADMLTTLRWTVPLDERAESLAVGQQQRVEILKALLAIQRAGRTGTLILDEPTAVLTPQETTELFAALHTLRQQGTSIVFISHKLAEVTQVCDQIAILQRGRLVHTGPAGERSAADIARLMVGATVALPRLERQHALPTPTAKADVLTLQHVTSGILKDVSLFLRPGEILGIAGVDGNGQSHLVQAILGTRRLTGGQVLLHGKPPGNLRQRLEQIAFIAEDRQREALVLPLSVEDNLLLKDYRDRRFNTLGWLRFSAWRSHTRSLMEQFDIRAAGATATVGGLSGGNQQKVVLARELGADQLHAKPVVLAVNPTRGLDVGATAFVLQKLLDARAGGAGILLIHSDLDELLAISDRVGVLFNGTLTGVDLPIDDLPDKQVIGRLMLGLPAAPLPHPQPRPRTDAVPPSVLPEPDHSPGTGVDR